MATICCRDSKRDSQLSFANQACFTCTNMCASVHMQLMDSKHLCSHCCIVPLLKTTEEKRLAMATHGQPHLTCPLSLSLMLSVFEFFLALLQKNTESVKYSFSLSCFVLFAHTVLALGIPPSLSLFYNLYITVYLSACLVFKECSLIC